MFCAYARPRYQVSVYRAIGPLVLSRFDGLCILKSFNLLTNTVQGVQRSIAYCLFSSPEPKAYRLSMVRPPSVVVVVRPSSTMLKLLLRNRWAVQSQILCGASLGRGERKSVRGIWVTWPPHPYMVKTLQKSSSEPAGRFPRNFVCSIEDSCPS